MSIKLEKIRKKNYPNSRYRHSYRFADRNNKYIIETYEKLHIPAQKNDIFHEIRPGEENFLDLIAFKYYQNEGLWWVIAEANNIINPFSIASGAVLRIPNYSNLRGYQGVLT